MLSEPGVSSATEALRRGGGLGALVGFYNRCSLWSPPLQVQHQEQLHDALGECSKNTDPPECWEREAGNTGRVTVKQRGRIYLPIVGVYLPLPSALPSPGACCSNFSVLWQPPTVVEGNAYSRAPPLENMNR